MCPLDKGIKQIYIIEFILLTIFHYMEFWRITSFESTFEIVVN